MINHFKSLWRFFYFLLTIYKNNLSFCIFILGVLLCSVLYMGKGHYYENHKVKNQKEHQKICKPSQRQKWLLSWSQLQYHNVKNGFLVDHYIEKNEKNIEKISFVWFSHFDYLWRKYLLHFGVNKNFKTWLNLT